MTFAYNETLNHIPTDRERLFKRTAVCVWMHFVPENKYELVYRPHCQPDVHQGESEQETSIKARKKNNTPFTCANGASGT